MKHLLLLFFVTSTLAFGNTNAASASKIVVVGNDALAGTIPCGNRVFDVVSATLADRLTARGFQVFSASVSDISDRKDGGCGHDKTAILQLVQSMKAPPMDIGVMFQIFPIRERKNGLEWLSARISADIIDISTSQTLGSAEANSSRPELLPSGCIGDCVLETASQHIGTLANDLAVVLALKLQTWTPTAAKTPSERVAGFNVIFINFDADDVTGAEEYLAAFRGYRTHRVVDCTISRCEYWYETDSDATRLNRNLRLMLDHLGIQGRITQADSRFIVDKISPLQ